MVELIKYSLQSGQIKDKRSARVSMPAQVVERVDEKTGKTKLVWRTDLMASKPYWTEWFTGLTQTFLNVAMKKQLILAGSERMDKELTIAQMQGKFSMRVIHDCGHVIQEDQPVQVAHSI
jgi:protein phosphatase methylesterase 1